MADNLELPVAIEQLDQFAKKLEELKSQGRLEEIREAFRDLSERSRALNNALLGVRQGTEEHRKLQTQLNLVSEAYRACSNALGGFEAALEAAKESTKDFNLNLEKTEEALKQMGMQANPAMSLMRGLFDQLKEGGKAVGGASALVLALGNDFTRGVIDPLASAEDQVRSFGALAVNLNGVLKSQAEVTSIANRGVLAFGGSMTDAAEVAPLLADRIAIISASTGASKKEVGEWVKAISEAGPGIKDMGGRVAAAGGEIEKFEQQILLARRAGLSLSDVQQLARTQFQNFNQSVEATSGNIALFAQLSTDTKLPVKDVMDQISAGSAPFGIFKRELGETANMWKVFADGMKGLPIAEIGKMFKTVSDNIANMKLETQAFVAQMSGMARGATALGGAIQMELQMRQGGAAKALEQVTQTITRMTGGRVITLEEAGQTPALEMQFQMQRQMAGQMLGVQGGAQQSRLLEVLQNVQKGGISSVDALQNISGLTEEGRKVQEQSVPLLTRIATSVGRVPEIIDSLNRIAAAPRAMVERAGRAAAVGRAGTAMDPKDIRMMGRYFAEGGQLFVAELKKSLPRLFDTLMARGWATGEGAGSLQRRRERDRRREAVPGEPEALTITPLAPGAGFSPFFTPREKRAQRTGTMPPMYIRPETGMAPGTSGTPDETRPGAEDTAGGGEEMYTATPLGSHTVEIKVICEKCLTDIIDKKLQGTAGEDYARR